MRSDRRGPRASALCATPSSTATISVSDYNLLLQDFVLVLNFLHYWLSTSALVQLLSLISSLFPHLFPLSHTPQAFVPCLLEPWPAVESEGRELGRTQSLPVDSLQQPGCESGPQELVMKPSVVAPVEI